MTTVPVRRPVAAGKKATVRAHSAPGLTALLHKFCARLKSPLTVTPVIVTAALTELSTTTYAGDGTEVPAVTLPKIRFAGDKLTPGAVPVPLRTTNCVPFVSTIFNSPLLPPVVAGLNVTEMAQLPLAGRVTGKEPQFDEVKAKSPVAETLPTVNVLGPWLVNVTICAGLVVPTVWLPKVRLLAERPPVGSKPTPLS